MPEGEALAAGLKVLEGVMLVLDELAHITFAHEVVSNMSAKVGRARAREFGLAHESACGFLEVDVLERADLDTL